MVQPPELRHSLLQVLLRSMGHQFGHHALADRIEQLEAELAMLNSKLTTTSQQLNAANVQLDTANVQRATHMKKHSTSHAEMQSVISKLQVRLSQEQQHVTLLEKRDWEASHNASEQLTNIKADFSQQMGASQARVRALENEVAHCRTDNQQIEAYTTQKRQDAAKTNEHLTAQIHQLQRALDATAEREDVGVEANGRAVFGELEASIQEAWAEVEHWQQLCKDLSKEAADAKEALKAAAVAAAEDTEKQILQQQLDASIQTNEKQREELITMVATLREAERQKTCFATEAYNAKAAMSELQIANELLEHCANNARELARETVRDTESASMRLVAKAQEQAQQAEKANVICDCEGQSMLCIANVHNKMMNHFNLNAACKSETYIYPPTIMNRPLVVRARQ